MKSPILFLDIDGVLNRCGADPKGTGLHSNKVELLRWIVERTGCRIVLSSTWRKYPHLLAKVKRLCLDIGAALIGCTPVLDRFEHGLWRAEPRGHEIKAWLDANNEEDAAIAILDDDHDMRTLTPFLVSTESFTGLTPEIATRVVAMLKRGALVTTT